MKVLFFAFTLMLSFVAQARDLPDFTELVEKYGNTVVNISTTQTIHENGGVFPGMPNLREDDPFYELFKRFLPPQTGPREFQTKSLGSGFIISSDGYILTNAHVVEAADEITVRTTDKREFKAKVIGSDKRTDVALIKIAASNLPKVVIGNPNQLRVGEWVAAIGSPFGFDSSVTAGIVSAKGRSFPDDSYVPFIQTDVAINPGNSGGPLFNLRGEVVGINSRIFSGTGGFMGLSFAIPIDVAIDVSNQLRTAGKVSRGYLGVSIQELTRDLAESFGIHRTGGAVVIDVTKGSPADKAGLEVSDVILKFDGKELQNSVDLPRLVGATKPGKTVTLQVWRKGELRDINITVAELPTERTPARNARQSARPANRLGLVVSDLSAPQRQQLKIANGVIVDDAQDAAARAGLRRGDIILGINNSAVRSAEQFNQLAAQLGSGKTVALLVKRGENSLYVPIKLGDK